ncbi:MAG: hypothetical protein DMG32_09120 [Acidobacteria bacterium]|nr:MAG: hypothetical protein DMG32_09120 [Acidobacteriota bacterium]
MAENEIVLRGTALNDNDEELAEYGAGSTLGARPSFPLATVPRKTQLQLLRMFADPNVLDKAERADLVGQLRECVRANPQISELRVLFGMALCVNLEVPDAIEELREGVRLTPNSFIAQLKMGELWMRLRVMDKAEEHTHRAALLAGNRVQAELARRQGASIRAMKHAGIERGGYKSPWLAVTRAVRRLWRRDGESREAIVAAEIR